MTHEELHGLYVEGAGRVRYSLVVAETCQGSNRRIEQEEPVCKARRWDHEARRNGQARAKPTRFLLISSHMIYSILSLKPM